MSKKKKKDQFHNIELQRVEGKITIPPDMELVEAERWIRRLREEEEAFVNPNIAIQCYPLDGLVAFYKALYEIFGWSQVKPIQTFFGSQPPQMISVPISHDETVECPIGQIYLPGLDKGYVMLSASIVQSKPCLVIGGEVKNKDVPAVKKLADRTRQIVEEESIYKGKAIILGQRADQVSRNKKLTPAERLMETPAFMRPLKMKPEELILSRDQEVSVKALLWTPIQNSQACRDAHIPLKRGILLEGPYGTGKSLTAAITAGIAVDNGWTFIRLEDPELLPSAIEMATWYQPAVIFAEDIDSVVGTEDRSSDINSILNTLDGIDKGREVFVVLTTNHAESIGKAFMRPGRIDGVITFEAPDAEATERLLHLYGRGMIASNAKLENAASELQGAPAAMIREVVERAKLLAISRLGGPLPQDEACLSGDDLYGAAVTLRRHHSLALGKVEEADVTDATLSRVRLLGKTLFEGIAEGFSRKEQQKLLESVVVSDGSDDCDDDN